MGVFNDGILAHLYWGERIYNEFLGIKVVKSQFWFLITFQFPNGEEKEVAVPQETFEKVSVGDKGTLVILNGAFFDFGDGEMIEEQEELNT